MDSLLAGLKKQASSRFISMGELQQGYRYPVVKFMPAETKFGRAIVCTIENGDGANLEVYLPKAIQMTDDQMMEFNARQVKSMAFIFNGKRGQAFIYDFVEL